MKKGFTLVELIIVIAVIGVLAAILIPTFSNVIEKANLKSAFSDAKNALSIYIAERSTGDGAIVVTDNSEFEVDKAGKTWYFTYSDNGLHENTDVHQSTGNATGSTITKTDVNQLPSNVEIHLALEDYPPHIVDAGGEAPEGTEFD